MEGNKATGSNSNNNKNNKTTSKKCPETILELITVSEKEFPVSVLDSLNTCILGRAVYQQVKKFLKSKSAYTTISHKVTSPNTTELEYLRKAFKVIETELGISYIDGEASGPVFQFNIQYLIDRYTDGRPTLTIGIELEARWPSLDVPLPVDTVCPLDGRRNCKYCKFWYRKTDYTCGNCELYQLAQSKEEPEDPLPPAPKQCVKEEHWIKLGRKLSGQVKLSFPETLTMGWRYRIHEDFFTKAGEAFKVAQVNRWFWRTVGKNPNVSHINSFREISSGMLSLFEVAIGESNSPLCVTVDVQSVTVDVDDEIILVSADLTLYLRPNLIWKPIEFSCDAYWSREHQLLVTFLMDLNNIGNLGDPSMKALCAECDLMEPSSTGCGYFSDRVSTLVDMYKTLLRESDRLSVEQRGVRFDKSFESTNVRIINIYSFSRSESYRTLRTSVTRHLVDQENLGYPPAPPLEGLTVELLDFQAQSLQWALDQERQEGGLHRQLYAPILRTDGTETGVWFSPYLNRMTKSRPVDVRGGFICEEMGLGKTVICLALILSNPAPAIDAEDADEHWDVVCPRIYNAESDFKMNDNLFRHLFDTPAQAQEALAVFKQDAQAVEERTSNWLKTCAPQNVSQASLAKLVNNVRDTKVREYQQQSDVNARRKELLAKLASPESASSSSSSSSNKANTIPVKSDPGDNVGTAGASGGCKYDINGWPANKAALRVANLRTRGTLVICPVSLVGQWSMEAKEKLADKSVKIYEYYGTNRKRSAEALREYDIVITTYETLGKDISTYSPSNYSTVRPPLLQLNWHRIIFDESHRMGKQALMTTAAQALCCKRRWMVTGTPFQGNVESISTQCRGIGLDALGSDAFWKLMMQDSVTAVSKKRRRHWSPESHGVLTNMMGTVAVNALLRQIMIRHSKAMKYTTNGITLTNLPAKVEEQVDITLSTREMQDYKLLEENLQTSYLELAQDGVGKHTIKIIAMIKELQRSCSGTNSCRDFEENDDDVNVPLSVIASANENEKNENDAQFQSSASSESKCSKLAWLMNTLQDIRDNRPEAKVLIFSQFTSTFSRIVGPLSRHGYQFRTLTSDMTMMQRKKALFDFRDDPPTTIFLLSMRSGAVGLNLTQANHVILMDPCMNKQLECQAVGRVHRLGQRREVKIYRLACLGTVEERILQMHSMGEVVSAVGTAGSLREDRVTLSEARYRSLLGLPPKEDASAELQGMMAGEEDLMGQHEFIGGLLDAEDMEEDDEDDDEDGGEDDDEDEDEDEDEAEAMEEEQKQLLGAGWLSQHGKAIVKKEPVATSSVVLSAGATPAAAATTAAVRVKAEKPAAVDEAFF